jgi:hypothetical protein
MAMTNSMSAHLELSFLRLLRYKLNSRVKETVNGMWQSRRPPRARGNVNTVVRTREHQGRVHVMRGAGHPCLPTRHLNPACMVMSCSFESMGIPKTLVDHAVSCHAHECQITSACSQSTRVVSPLSLRAPHL